jgi:hypothetical protein
MLVAAQRRWPDRLGLRDSFELLAGTGRLREALLAGRDAEDIAESWLPGARAFLAARESVLLY